MYNAHAMRKLCISRTVTPSVTGFVLLHPRFD
jgi:hypothetical protein